MDGTSVWFSVVIILCTYYAKEYLLGSLAHSTRGSSLTIVVCEVVVVNVCRQSVSIVDVLNIFQRCVGVYGVIVALRIYKYTISCSLYDICSYIRPKTIYQCNPSQCITG